MRKTLNDDNPTISANIRRLREGAGLTQVDVALALGISHQQVQKYESGRNRLPLQLVPQLCDLFAVPVEELLRGVGACDASGLSFEQDVAQVTLALTRVADRHLRARIVRAVDVLSGAP